MFYAGTIADITLLQAESLRGGKDKNYDRSQHPPSDTQFFC
jgi:hypothetical protein